MRPSYFDPCLPVLVRTPPKGSYRVHQTKMDGYRCLVAKIGQRVRLYSKNGTEWSERLPGLVEAFAVLRTDFILERASLGVGLDLHVIRRHRRRHVGVGQAKGCVRPDVGAKPACCNDEEPSARP